MKKIVSTIALAAACVLTLSAQEAKQDNKPAVKFYGFVRNFASIDDRVCSAGTQDLFMHLPKDQNINAEGVDLNAQTTARMVALTSRLGVDVNYNVDGYKIGGKIEADFYNQNGSTAVLRLRQAYLTVNRGIVTMKMGQAWHPMAADMVDVFSLNTGAPFTPFSRTPVWLFDVKATDNIIATAGAISQMQYLSNGPDGNSQNYIKHGGSEFYAGLSYVDKHFTFRVGADFLTISPRWQGKTLLDVKYPVDEKVSMVTPFFYAKYKNDNFGIQTKVTLNQAGEHLYMMGGYAISNVTLDLSNGHTTYDYTPTKGLTANVSTFCKFGKGFKAILFGGYYKNLGLAQEVDPAVYALGYYYNTNGATNLTQAYRVTPELVYTIGGRLDIGLEYEMTAATYGDFDGQNKRGLATQNLRTVTNNRFQLLTKFTF